MGNTARRWETFDAVKGILAYLEDDSFLSTAPILHKAMYDVARQDKYGRFFDDYYFSETSPYPFSRELQTDIINLEQSGHLSTLNPDFAETIVKPKLRATFNKNQAELFSEEERRILQEMASFIFEFIKK